ncbi:MAG: S8 family serine peptidase [Anaerolineae bacterium]|nr:S8 family serine peptidase [Anaerolineae bacterium]
MNKKSSPFTVVRWTGYALILAVLLSAPALMPLSVQSQPLKERVPYPPIRLETGSFAPGAGETLEIPPELRITESQDEAHEYYIVQFAGPVYADWKNKVTALGGTVLDYVPDFAFITFMDSATARKTAALPEVIWVGLYQPAYKISQDLLQNVPDVLDLMAQTFANASIDDITTEARALGAVISHRSSHARGGLLRLQLDSGQLGALAHIPGVRRIEPFYERVLYNDIARGAGLMDAEAAWNDLGLYGEGQVVAVADTGLDTGSLSTLHEDFLGAPTGCSGTDRIIATYALGRTNNWSDSCNSVVYGPQGGHGTHVAGSVLGNGCESGSSGSSYSGSHAGLAPQAGLVFQSIMDSGCNLGGIPDDLNDLFSQAQAAGANIHTNSWGAAVAGSYTTDAYNADLYAWNHKDFTILFAAGNDGIDSNSDGFVDQDSMGAPGTAKNVITVGASENLRLYGGVNPEHSGDPWDEVQCSGNGGGAGWGNCWPTDFPVDPLLNDRLSNNGEGMAAFSSRGPTNDGRIKPDIVAPGSNILSTKSQGQYVGSGWGPGENQYYQFMGGTSMATPLTAGGVALVRQFYTDIEGITPSAALIKATLINGAVDLYPGQYADPLEQNPRLPNYVQGWGRVDIGNATDGSHVYEDVTDGAGLTTSASDSYPHTICTTDHFKVTLVWTDYPGSSLVNDLDLTVTAPDGTTTYYGNVFSNGWSTTGGSPDRVNNVESVYIDAPAPGEWTISISGYNVPQGPQGYALVVDMPDNVCDPDFTLNVTPDSQDVCRGDATDFTATVGQILNFADPVTLSASGIPANASHSFAPNPATPPGVSTLTIDSGAADAGTYAIDATGVSGSRQHFDSVTLHIFEPTAAPVPASPTEGSTGVSTTPAFGWSVASQAASYAIDIAAGPNFETLVDSATGLTSPAYTPDTALEMDTIYYWRVRATNPCGDSAWSAPQAFRTASSGCWSYTSADVPLAINDRSWIESDLSLPDIQITDIDVRIDRISHTWDADLDIYIRHPDATQVLLSSDNGSSGDNYIDTRFDDEAATAVTAGSAPFTGSYRPEGNLATFDSRSALGTWVLRVYDDANGDTGALEGWGLELCGGTTPESADYSDLNSSYGIAWHTGNGTLRLGTNWDADDQFSADYDNDRSDDGVSVSTLQAGQPASVQVTVQGAATNGRWLQAWFDWNRNGAFDAYEQVFDTLVGDGLNELSATVPTTVTAAIPYRFRLYDNASSPTAIQAHDSRAYGGAASGEVEDGTATVPTAVALASFAALRQENRVLLTWETASEIDVLGFNLYRSANGDDRVRLNANLIPAQALGAALGAAYSWEDNAVTPDEAYTYWLEEVSAAGSATLHGPVSVEAAGPTATTLLSVHAERSGSMLWLLGLAVAGWVILRRRRC